MKVLLTNGSPHAKGCTYTALCEVAEALNKEGIETQIFQVGTKPISGCLGCGACMKTGRCVISDTVNDFWIWPSRPMVLYSAHRCILHQPPVC